MFKFTFKKFLLVTALLAFILLLFDYTYAGRCLDNGGSWSYKGFECEFNPTNHQPQPTLSQ